MECFLDRVCFANPFYLQIETGHLPFWLRFLLRTEPVLYCPIKKRTFYVAFLLVLVFVLCSSVVCKPHFPVSARYSNQRANKDYLTVHVYSLEEKTEWRHSMYVSENSQWDFKVWPTLKPLSSLRSSLCLFQLARRTRHLTNSHKWKAQLP